MRFDKVKKEQENSHILTMLPTNIDDKLNVALLRHVSSNIHKAVTTKKNIEKVNTDLAIDEQAYMENVLSSLGLEVHEIPSDEEHPDCVFIEDPVFFLNGKAFYPQPGHETRRGEVAVVRKFVQEKFPNLETACMAGEGFMDGGDICYMGGSKKEILVGLSTRTNNEGIDQFKASFPEWNVTPIGIPRPEEGGLLHLITMTSKCSPGMLAIGQSEPASKLKKTIKEESVGDYDFFSVPDDWAANCVFVNGHVLHCSKEEYPQSFAAFQDRFGDLGIPMKNKEFDKIDGSLTCRARLLQYQ